MLAKKQTHSRFLFKESMDFCTSRASRINISNSTSSYYSNNVKEPRKAAQRPRVFRKARGPAHTVRVPHAPAA